MESFFGRLQGYLKQRYDGRYLAVILCELIREDPKVAAVVFPDLTGTAIEALAEGRAFPTIEERLSTGRRADLAIRSQDRIVALAEIKVEDGGKKGNAAQLEDYAKVCADDTRIVFAFLSKHDFSADELAELDRWKRGAKCRRLRIYELADRLRAYRQKAFSSRRAGSQGARLIDLVLDYLKERQMVGYEAIKLDNKTLTNLVRSLLPLPHHHGMGRLRTTDRVEMIPIAIGLLIGNISFLGSAFRSRNRHLCSTRLGANVSVEPGFDEEVRARGKNVDLGELVEKHCWGGSLIVSASGILQSKQGSGSAVIELYYAVALDTQRGKAEPYVGAAIWGDMFRGGGDDEERWSEERMSLAADEATARDTLRRRLDAQIKVARKYAKPGSHRAANALLDAIDTSGLR